MKFTTTILLTEVYCYYVTGIADGSLSAK